MLMFPKQIKSVFPFSKATLIATYSDLKVEFIAVGHVLTSNMIENEKNNKFDQKAKLSAVRALSWPKISVTVTVSHSFQPCAVCDMQILNF